MTHSSHDFNFFYKGKVPTCRHRFLRFGNRKKFDYEKLGNIHLFNNSYICQRASGLDCLSVVVVVCRCRSFHWYYECSCCLVILQMLHTIFLIHSTISEFIHLSSSTAPSKLNRCDYGVFATSPLRTDERTSGP